MVIHHSDLYETNAKHSLYHMPIEIHWASGDRCDFCILEILEIAGTAASTLRSDTGSF